jgi:hypothetical protein
MDVADQNNSNTRITGIQDTSKTTDKKTQEMLVLYDGIDRTQKW